MLVYDFKNVAKIKNLKNSESVEPKHAERIAEIPDSIVKDFDYEKYKSKATLAPELKLLFQFKR